MVEEFAKQVGNLCKDSFKTHSLLCNAMSHVPSTEQALDAGVGISDDMMVQMLTELCRRRACKRLELRPPTPPKPLTLEVDGVGRLTVDPSQEVSIALE